MAIVVRDHNEQVNRYTLNNAMDQYERHRTEMNPILLHQNRENNSEADR